MERLSMVHRVLVEHAGRTYRADYFVEDGVIHASLDGHIVLRPLASAEPADTVRTMLSGHLAQRARKLSAAARWAPLAHHRANFG